MIVSDNHKASDLVFKQIAGVYEKYKRALIWFSLTIFHVPAPFTCMERGEQMNESHHKGSGQVLCPISTMLLFYAYTGFKYSHRETRTTCLFKLLVWWASPLFKLLSSLMMVIIKQGGTNGTFVLSEMLQITKRMENFTKFNQCSRLFLNREMQFPPPPLHFWTNIHPCLNWSSFGFIPSCLLAFYICCCICIQLENQLSSLHVTSSKLLPPGDTEVQVCTRPSHRIRIC